MENVLTLQLIKLNCYQSDESDADEVFLKFNKKKIWPSKHRFEKMKSGSIEINMDLKEITVNSMITIELWDYDWLSSNDLLGTFKIIIDKAGGPFNTDMATNKKEGDRARYNLEWQLK